MARLPNSDQAILDIRKIEDYCLNPQHPRGRHKARVFRETLGIGRDESYWFRSAILSAVRQADVAEPASDAAGRRWRIDIFIERQNRKIVVRTVWIIRTGENTPRFVTCWVP